MKKGNKNLLKAIISIFIAILLFLSLISLESSMLQNYEKGPAVLAKTNITEKTMITEDNVNKYFYVTNVENSLITSDTYTNIDDLVGKIANIDITENQIMSKQFVRDSNLTLDTIEDPVEVSFNVGSTNAVNGRIRSGDIVDISIYGGTESASHYAITNVYIKSALTGDGTVIENSDTTSIATSFIVVLERKNANTFIDYLNMGQIYITYPQNQEARKSEVSIVKYGSDQDIIEEESYEETTDEETPDEELDLENEVSDSNDSEDVSNSFIEEE